MNGTRRIVLDRIREALAAAPPEPVRVPRDYERAPAHRQGDAERFAETVAEYQAQVLRVDAADIAATVAGLTGTGAGVAIPAGLPREWVAGIDTIVDRPEKPLAVT